MHHLDQRRIPPLHSRSTTGALCTVRRLVSSRVSLDQNRSLRSAIVDAHSWQKLPIGHPEADGGHSAVYSVGHEVAVSTRNRNLARQTRPTSRNAADLLHRRTCPTTRPSHTGVIWVWDSGSRFSCFPVCIEEDPLPPDTTIIRYTWAKVNKDGLPDRCFNGNYQITVVAYGSLVFCSPTGIDKLGIGGQFRNTWEFLMRKLKTP